MSNGWFSKCELSRAVDAAIPCDTPSKAKVKPPDTHKPKASFRELYQFASARDKKLTLLAVICSTLAGSGAPISMWVMVSSMDEAGGASGIFSMESMRKKAFYMTCIASGIMINIFVYNWAADLAKINQSAIFKKEYVDGLLRQDIGWFDVNEPVKLLALFGELVVRLESGLSKFAMQVFENLGSSAGSLFLSLYYCWDATFLMLSIQPLVFWSSHYKYRLMKASHKKMEMAYADAAAISISALSSMRTVASYSLEATISVAYDERLFHAEREQLTGIVRRALAESVLRSSRALMVGVGLLYGGIKIAQERVDSEFTYEVAFNTSAASPGKWHFCMNDCNDPYDLNQLRIPPSADDCKSQGLDALKMTCDSAKALPKQSELLLMLLQPTGSGFKEHVDDNDSYIPCKTSALSVLVALVCMESAADTLLSASQSVSALAGAKHAAAEISEIARRIPEIDHTSAEGVVLAKVIGDIEVRSISFSYPARPDLLTCQNYCLHVQAGHVVGMCGASGSGKSTLIALIQRFYDPTSGTIFVDGTDIKLLNLAWFRKQTALVEQEPVLFTGSVEHNIAYGCPEATRTEIEAAAEMANADFFIKNLPDKYSTQVGHRGGKLSGGQKQRLAIARAVVRRPSILLLDEATSALDCVSERVVQKALDDIMTGQKRTTLTIAHRLSTIRHANRIAVLNKGAVVEHGTYDELFAIGPRGHFYTLISAQERSIPSDESKVAQARSQISEVLDHAPIVQVGSYKDEVEQKHGSSGEETDCEKDIAEKKRSSMFMMLLKYHDAGDELLLMVGSFLAILEGATLPISAYLMVETLQAYYKPNPEVTLNRTILLSSMYLSMGVSIILVYTLEETLFGAAAAHLTRNLRKLSLRTLLRQEIGFFDEERNSAGSLNSFMSVQLTYIQGMTGEKLGIYLKDLSACTVGLCLIFIFGYWQLSLMLLGTLPLFVCCIVLKNKISGALSQGDDTDDHQATAESTFSEAVASIRTIASFGLEHSLTKDYRNIIDSKMPQEAKIACVSGATLGCARAMPRLVAAAMILLGGFLVNEDIDQMNPQPDSDGCLNLDLGFLRRFLVPSFVMSGVAGAIGAAAQSQTDATLARCAAEEFFTRVNRKSLIDIGNEDGRHFEGVCGAIDVRDVVFAYPTRRDFNVCRGYSLEIMAGHVTALCGPSGSGKSTIIALIERFYDADAGVILLDGNDIKSLHLRWLRERIGLVQQEPVLFEGTISANILNGKLSATKTEIQAAACVAISHDFIMEQPAGYLTEVGACGCRLSGGQKQRVAIARAVLRRPAVFLLDEATSALDNTSEKLVQAALNDVIETYKTTTVVIAHRLTTIQNADKIAVVDAGRVQQEGTHNALLQTGGLYHELWLSAT